MELTWLLMVAAVCFLLPLVLVSNATMNHRRLLPPGPPVIPILGNLVWLTTVTNGVDFLRVLRRLHSRLGPLLVIRFGSFQQVNVADRRLAHVALVERGAAVADRPAEMASRDMLGPFSAFTIHALSYGPRWSLLRRNLAAEVANPARIRQFARPRELVVAELVANLRGDGSGSTVSVRDAFHHAMFSLLLPMCFGEVLDDSSVVGSIAVAMRDLVVYGGTQLNVFLFFPAITTRLFRGRLQAMHDKRQKLKTVYFLPLINARRKRLLGDTDAVVLPPEKADTSTSSTSSSSLPHSYVDSLFDIRLDKFEDGGGRPLTDDEIASLCIEFLIAGTDLPVTALEWIMAELIKNPDIQDKLYEEIKGTIRSSAGTKQDAGDCGSMATMVSEDDLHKMPYLKAVVLEGLRRHPPGHMLVPRAAREDVELGAYVVPKGSAVNFMLYDMGMDEKTWDRPTLFMPERFLPGGDGEALDITGTKGVKMIPFGAGRRLCPGLKMAMLHIEYFLANLVAPFDWKEVEADKVDVTSEEAQLTIVMGKPLRARLASRPP